MTEDARPGSGASLPEDPSGIEEPHDVLAAEEFAMPTRAPGIPGDPTGISEPHDVLAAEEFAMPTPGAHADGARARRLTSRGVPWAALAAAALLIALTLRRLRS
jgi:hypothetical protein